MKGEYISIETLRMYQEIEKENKELHKKIDKAIEYIKNTNFWGIYEDVPMSEVKYGNELLDILGDSNE